LAVNLAVDFGDGRFGADTLARALRAAEAQGYRLVRAERAGDQLSAWIDWQFAPSWWSSEARAGEVWYALDRDGAIAGFAAFDVRGSRFPWLRGYEQRGDVGIFGPYGVAQAVRGQGLGGFLLDAALAALRAKGYGWALIPAVGFERLVAMYQARAGARVVDAFSYDSPRRYRATILASGGGTNAQNVLDRSADGRLPLEIGALIANADDAGALRRARMAGVATRTVVWDRAAEPRATYDTRVLDAVAATEPELVLLLGWMHRLPPAFVDRFADILNVHPAFLPFDATADDVVVPDGRVMPAFRGAHALRDALAAGAPWLGASVHRVTAQVDRGEIVVRTPLQRGAALSAAEQVVAALRPIEHAAVAAAVRRWCFERSYHTAL
jgi:phosphoribosylglycinamide formyltransferase-1